MNTPKIIGPAEAAELRYGKGNATLMEWVEQQSSVTTALGQCVSIIGDDDSENEAFSDDDADAVAIYLDFANVGQALSHVMAMYGEQDE